MVDEVVDDTHLLVGQCQTDSIVALLGVAAHGFSLAESRLWLVVIGVALADVAPSLVIGVPTLVFLHPLALFLGLFT